VASESYRKRKALSGTKTDHIDGWGLADALRVDGRGWKLLEPMDPLTQQSPKLILPGWVSVALHRHT